MGAIGSKEVSEVDVKAAFDKLDINKDGNMSASELKVWQCCIAWLGVSGYCTAI
jgi:Ca2+-binding EF-hand superfamily protein